MFCTKCANKLLANAKFCDACGTPVISEKIEQVNEATRTQQVYQQNSHPYNTLGGWLAFAVYAPLIAVGLITLLFLISFFSMFSYLRYLGGWYILVLLISLTGYIMTCYFCIKFSNMVRKKQPEFLRFYELTMITLSSLSLLVMIMTGFSGAAESIRSLLSGVLSFLIWTAYFRKSVRVRTYMGSDAYLKCSVFFKNSTAPPPADGGF